MSAQMDKLLAQQAKAQQKLHNRLPKFSEMSAPIGCVTEAGILRSCLLNLARRSLRMKKCLVIWTMPSKRRMQEPG